MTIRAVPIVVALMLAASPQAEADLALEQGRVDFIALCAPCHGANGKGDGPKAAGLSSHPADLTRITARYGLFPEEKIFGAIAGLDMPEGHGTRAMPIWGDVFVTEGVGKGTTVADATRASDEASGRIAGLVRYIASIQDMP
jgi:mono/diheme cytochrome c family protein